MYTCRQWLLSEATAAMGKTFIRNDKVKKEGEKEKKEEENEERKEKENLIIILFNYMEIGSTNLITCNLISALLYFLLYR